MWIQFTPRNGTSEMSQTTNMARRSSSLQPYTIRRNQIESDLAKKIIINLCGRSLSTRSGLRADANMHGHDQNNNWRPRMRSIKSPNQTCFGHSSQGAICFEFVPFSLWSVMKFSANSATSALSEALHHSLFNRATLCGSNKHTRGKFTASTRSGVD